MKFATPTHTESEEDHWNPDDLLLQGVLFFELFHPVTTGKERFHVLSGLRHRQLPLNLLSERPQEAEFVLSLLHPDPSSRPSAAKLLQPGCLTALHSSISTSPVSPDCHSPCSRFVYRLMLEVCYKSQVLEQSCVNQTLSESATRRIFCLCFCVGVQASKKEPIWPPRSVAAGGMP